MFSVEGFVADCRAAIAEDVVSVKRVLERAVRDPAAVAVALPVERAEIMPLCVSPDLTVLKVVWAPGMSFRPHNHLMWAAIGLYAGQEDNVFYRRSDSGIVESGKVSIRCGEAALLGSDTIHSVVNPLGEFTAALHVYGGDLPHRSGRSEWDEATYDEVAYDFDRAVRYFADANG